MRVLHVMEATIGGTRRHIVDVGLGQRAAGVDVHLVLARERQADFAEDMQRLAEAGCVVEHLPMVREIRPALDYAHLRELRRILRDARPDIVHTHSSKGGVLGRAASSSTGIGRRVHTPHTFAFLFGAMFGPLKRRVFHGLERHLGKRTQRMIAVSESEAETMRSAQVVDPSRIRVVPNGIDPEPWQRSQPLERAALGVPEDAPLAAVVGLLNPAKGQDLALAALARPGCEAVHLLVVGHGADGPGLEAEAGRLGIADRVHFLGWRTDVAALLRTADMLVLPSRWEGMPYIVLEAMASGLPVVASAVDGARELVRDGETGRVVPVEDVAALAGAIGELAGLAPVRRRALGERGAARLGERYTRDAMVQGLIEVYEGCLEEGRRG